MHPTTTRLTPRIQPGRWPLTAFTALTIVLILASVAWACTPSVHSFSITSPSSKSGPAAGGTAITVGGYCYTSSCTNADTNLYQDEQPTVAIPKLVLDHQTSCDASDEPIGTSSIDTSSGAVSGSGTTSARLPGTYIICSGVDTEIMYDYFTMT